jgi:hypothetical protein
VEAVVVLRMEAVVGLVALLQAKHPLRKAQLFM